MHSNYSYYKMKFFCKIKKKFHLQNIILFFEIKIFFSIKYKYKKNIGYFNEIYHILLFYMVKSFKKIEIYLYSNLKR